MRIWLLFIKKRRRADYVFVGNYTSLKDVESAKQRCLERGLATSDKSFHVDEEYHRTDLPYSKGEIPFEDRNYGVYDK
jgi:hypothetical protein